MTKNANPCLARSRYWFLLLGLSSLGQGTIYSAEQESVHDLTLRLLDKRSQQQVLVAQAMKVFHQFQFTDRIVESRIRFENQIVDDAGKAYKAAHYDHGNV